jgi:hypothetical protein
MWFISIFLILIFVLEPKGGGYSQFVPRTGAYAIIVQIFVVKLRKLIFYCPFHNFSV